MALESYIIHLLILIGIYAILAISLNLSMGFAGLLNIGHVAFYGIGAYTSALLAFLLAIPTLKLKGDYFAIATLWFAIVIENIFKNWISLTRGPLGLPGIPKPGIFGFSISGFSYLVLVAFFLLVVYLFSRHITNAPFGRVLKAIREDELAASSLGKNVVKYKTQILMISAFFAGIAGSL